MSDDREPAPTSSEGRAALVGGPRGVEAALAIDNRGADAALAIGQRIGHYRVVRKLGQGGMGAVFEAVHEQLGRRAAIKVLLPVYSAQPGMAGRFLNEARATHIVKHPGIVDTYEYGQLDDGTLYIVMEHLEGEALSARLLRQSGRLGRGRASAPPLGLALPMALRLARQLASALAAAHRRGVVHRDLKPDNVIIVSDPDMPGGERARLLDFGLAKLTHALHATGAEDPHTRSGVIMGTPRYMAPEQCRGVAGVTDRADVYALGVLLYQMLCGATPFDGEGAGDLLVAHIQQQPPPLLARVPGLPPALDGLVMEMLAKAPEARPDMSQVARRLDDLSGPIAAALPPVLPRLPRAPQAPLDGDDVAGGSLLQSVVSLPESAVVEDAASASAAPELSGAETRGPAAPLTSESAAPPPVVAGRGSARPAARDPVGQSGITIGPLTRDELAAFDRTRPLRVVLFGGLLLALVAGGVTWSRRHAALEASAVSTALSGLTDALRERRWEEAQALAEGLLARSTLSPAARAQGEAAKRQARQEREACAVLAQMTERAAARDLDQVLRLYPQVPAASLYQAEARQVYDRSLTPWLLGRVERARAARGAGRCADFHVLLQDALTVAPGHQPALKLRKAGCSGRGRESEVSTLSALSVTDVAGLPRLPLETQARVEAPPTPIAPPTPLAPPVVAPPPAAPVAAAVAPVVTPPALPPSQPSAARPAPPEPPPPSAEDAARILTAAQQQLNVGNYSGAIATARPLTRLPGSRRVAWSVMGTAACRSRNVELVQQAYFQMDADGARFMRSVCERSGVYLANGRFRAGAIPAAAPIPTMPTDEE